MGLYEGRVAVVTGAAQGIGFAVAARMAAEGARVVMADIQAEKVAAAARRLDPAGQRTAACRVDVADAASVAAMVETAQTRFGGLDVLANVAGGSGSRIIEDIEDMTDAIWDSVVGANLRGTFVCSRAAVPLMKRRGELSMYVLEVIVNSAMAQWLAKRGLWRPSLKPWRTCPDPNPRPRLAGNGVR